MIGLALKVAGLLPARIWAIGGVVLALGLYHWHAVHAARQAGFAAAIEEMRKANDEAKRKADEAAANVANCRGTWDRARGVCVPDNGPSR